MKINKNLVYILGVVLIILIGYMAISKRSADVATENWLTYENQEFGFRIKHPADWIVFEAPENNIQPAFNFYPSSYDAEDLPLIHHSNTPNVSVFPKGVPTEGIFGATVPSTLKFKQPPLRAMDFTLENGDVWATFAGYQTAPKNWTGGFIWARAAIDNYSYVCFGQGKEKPINQCDLMLGEDTLIHRGSVNKEMRAIQEKMLESFEFTTTDLIKFE